MRTSMIRIIVCSIIAICLLNQSFSMMEGLSITKQTFSLTTMGLALLIMIYGFSPSMARTIINAIVKIVSIPLKALFR